jgi:hypothetical protein
MTLIVRCLSLAGAMLAVGLAAGCAKPQATLRYATGGLEEDVTYDMAVFQLARDRKIQVILFRRTAAPIGEADPDFEYVFFEVPERDRFGWLKEDRVPAYRWVRQNSEDRLWVGTAGQIREEFWQRKRSLHFDFQTTMEPVAGTPGGAYVLAGHIRCTEDMVLTQGLINRYGDWLLTLLGQKPPPAAGPKPKAKAAAPAPPK